MRKDKIIQTVISKNLKMEQIGEQCKSAFAVVHQCLSAVAITELSEDEKKKKLINNLQSFWRGKSFYVDGCKREQIQKIAALVFGIRSEQGSSLLKEISLFTFQELYLYYCYVERLAKADEYLSQSMRNYYKEKQRKSTEQKAMKEQAAKEEREREEQTKVEKMDKEEKWRYDIFEKQQDIEYFQKLTAGGEFNDQDSVAVAQLLREYWAMHGKWEGSKVSKKQVVKIDKVKEILDKAVK